MIDLERLAQFVQDRGTHRVLITSSILTFSLGEIVVIFVINLINDYRIRNFINLKIMITDRQGIKYGQFFEIEGF